MRIRFRPLPDHQWNHRLGLDAGAYAAAAQRFQLLTLRQAPVPLGERHVARMLSPGILEHLAIGTDAMADALGMVSNLARYENALTHHTGALEDARGSLRKAARTLDALTIVRRTETTTMEDK